VILSLVEKPTDSESRLRMIEDLGEGHTFPGQSSGAGQDLLLALEVL